MIKKILSFLNQFKIKIFILSISIFSVCFIGLRFVNQQTTMMTISLNYEKAANGLNPNGSKFNIFDIKSDEVLENTLKFAGLSDEMTTEELGRNISVILSSNTSEKIPTSYKIIYKKDWKQFDVSSKQITKFLFKAYKKYFKEHYSNNTTVLKYEIQDFSDSEYLTIINELKLDATRISDYLNDRLKEHSTFRNTNNYSFEDLKKNVDNVIDINISNLNAYVIENGLAKDTASLQNLLEYKNELLNVDYKTMLLGYETNKEGISLYDSNMSAIVLIPSIDKDNDYYMSKTKIGIDYLAKDSNTYLFKSEWYKSEIEKNKNIASKINENPQLEQKEKADQMISKIQETLHEIGEQSISFDKEYVEYRDKNYISCKMENKTISKKILIVLFGVSICLSILLIGLLHVQQIFKKVKKEQVAEEEKC